MNATRGAEQLDRGEAFSLCDLCLAVASALTGPRSVCMRVCVHVPTYPRLAVLSLANGPLQSLSASMFNVQSSCHTEQQLDVARCNLDVTMQLDVAR